MLGDTITSLFMLISSTSELYIKNWPALPHDIIISTAVKLDFLCKVIAFLKLLQNI